MNTNFEQTTRPEKRRRGLKPVEIIVATVAICIITVILWLLTITGGTPGPTFDFAERYNELTRPAGFTEADNAADLYVDAFTYLRPIPHEVGSYAKNWIGEGDEELRTRLADWLKSNEKAFEYARLAAAKPYYWKPTPVIQETPFSALSDDLSQFKYLAIALGWQAIHDASHQKPAEAFANLETSYSIGRHLTGHTRLLEQLVAMAIESAACQRAMTILSHSEPTPETLARFQTFLQDRTPLAELSFRVEHLGCQWIIAKCFTDNGRGDGHIVLNEYNEWLNLTYSSGSGAAPAGRSLKTTLKDTLELLGYRSVLIFQAVNHDGRKETLRKTDEVYALLKDMKSQTPWQLQARKTTYGQEIDRVVGTGQDLLLRQHVSSCDSIIAIYQRISGYQSAVLTVVALMRYKADKDVFPESLAQLQAAGYLTTLPQDLYSDQPLVYRRTDEGFILYSVGANFKDDGGTKHQWRSGNSIGPDEDYIYWPVPVREVPQQSGYGLRKAATQSPPPDPNAPVSPPGMDPNQF